jgi:hypothetical protein
MNGTLQVPRPALHREEGLKRIEQEDHLVNHRFSWLVGCQAFLLMAFVSLRNDPKFFVVGTLQRPLDPHDERFLNRIDLLVYLIAVVGLLNALCVFSGVFAAFMAIPSWRQKVEEEEQQFLTADFKWNLLGGNASFVPAPVFAWVWITLLVAEWPLRVTHFQFWGPIVVAALTFALWAWYNFWMFDGKIGVSVRANRRG